MNQKGKCRRSNEPTSYTERRVRQTRSNTNKIENKRKRQARETEANAEISAAKKPKVQGRTTCTAAAAAASAAAAMAAGNSCDIDGFFVCAEPNCNKKYRQFNGLKYHTADAHSDSTENKSNIELEDEHKLYKRREAIDDDIPTLIVQNTPPPTPVKKNKSPVPTPVKEASKIVKSEPVTTSPFRVVASATSVVSRSPVSTDVIPSTSPCMAPMSITTHAPVAAPLSSVPVRKVNTTSVFPVGVPASLPGSFAVSPCKVDEHQPQTSAAGEIIQISHGKYKYQISGPGLNSHLPQSNANHGNGNTINGGQTVVTSSTARGTTVSIPVAVSSTTGAIVPLSDGKTRIKHDKVMDKKSIAPSWSSQRGLTSMTATVKCTDSIVNVPPKCSAGLTANQPPKASQPTLNQIGEPAPVSHGLQNNKDQTNKKRIRHGDGETGSSGKLISEPTSTTAGDPMSGQLVNQFAGHPQQNDGVKTTQGTISTLGQQSLQSNFHVISHSELSQVMNQELSKLTSPSERPETNDTTKCAIESVDIQRKSQSIITSPINIAKHHDSNSVIKTSSAQQSVLDKARQHSSGRKFPAVSSNLPSTSVPLRSDTTPDTRAADVISPAYSDISDANDAGSVTDVDQPIRSDGMASGNHEQSQTGYDYKEYYANNSSYSITAPQQSVLTGMNSPLR